MPRDQALSYLLEAWASAACAHTSFLMPYAMLLEVVSRMENFATVCLGTGLKEGDRFESTPNLARHVVKSVCLPASHSCFQTFGDVTALSIAVCSTWSCQACHHDFLIRRPHELISRCLARIDLRPPFLTTEFIMTYSELTNSQDPSMQFQCQRFAKHFNKSAKCASSKTFLCADTPQIRAFA